MHVVGGGRGEEDGRTRQVGRLAPPACGDPLEDRLDRSGSSRSARVLSVAKYPGAIAFTFTPWGAHSFASARTSPATPDFDAVYETTLTPPWKLNMDAVKMILPAPRSTIGRASSRASTNCDVRFVCSTRRHCSSSCSSAGARAIVPALLTRMSTSSPSRSTEAASCAAPSSEPRSAR